MSEPHDDVEAVKADWALLIEVASEVHVEGGWINIRSRLALALLAAVREAVLNGRPPADLSLLSDERRCQLIAKLQVQLIRGGMSDEAALRAAKYLARAE